jgi:hypothetical protein
MSSNAPPANAAPPTSSGSKSIIGSALNALGGLFGRKANAAPQAGGTRRKNRGVSRKVRKARSGSRKGRRGGRK